MLLQLQVWAFMLLQEGGAPAVISIPLDVESDGLARPRLVVITLFLMSAWSIGVMIDRIIAFNAARKQSRRLLRPWLVLCARASWMKLSRSPTGTARAIWPKSL